MRTALVTAASTEALRLGDVKRHLRLSTAATDEDKELKIFRAAARGYAEDYTGRKLIKQRWYFYRDEWPEGDTIKLPYAPLSSSPSTAIVYRKSDGTSTTLSSTAWALSTVREPGVVHLGYGESWPSDSLWNVDPIRVEYKCGYSSQSTGIPEAITHAMLLMVGHMYENRENTVPGYMGLKEIPDTAKRLLNPYRVWHLSGYDG